MRSRSAWPCCADAGVIVNQLKGGAVGGIGMALTEAATLDDRFGRYVTKDRHRQARARAAHHAG